VNVMILMVVALPLFVLAYLLYSRYIARQMGEDRSRQTPAVALCDGRDYCPSRGWVVFAHHFASIAGAGPIIGPVAALMWGVGPVWLWIVLGGIFVGAVHDYTALFVSIREKGHSIAEVVRATLGTGPFLLMVGFIIMMLVLVTGCFLRLSAVALTSTVPLTALGLPPTQALVQTVEKDGAVHGMIGGIASTSVIVITLMAPLVGYLHYRRSANLALVSLLAIGACVLGVAVGLWLPVRMSIEQWTLALSAYTLVASAIPVWVLLQPRDFTNVFILYLGVGLLVAGAVATGLGGGQIQHPLWNPQEARGVGLGFLWPALFITVACGAVSGFHALVAGGTVSKQVMSEPAARQIGYGAMLLESLLAVGVVCAIGFGLSHASYRQILYSGKASNPVLAFALGMGELLKAGLGIPTFAGTIFGILMVEGFIATSLDTAVRLTRYLLDEFWTTVCRTPPRLVRHPWFNSGIAVALMLLFAWTNAFQAIWPLFGTANQLLAAFTLIAVTAWLAARGRRVWFAAAPAVFMLVTTCASLIILGLKYRREHNWLLGVTDAVLIALTVCLLTWAVRCLISGRKAAPSLATEGERPSSP